MLTAFAITTSNFTHLLVDIIVSCHSHGTWQKLVWLSHLLCRGGSWQSHQIVTNFA